MNCCNRRVGVFMHETSLHRDSTAGRERIDFFQTFFDTGKPFFVTERVMLVGTVEKVRAVQLCSSADATGSA